MSPPTPNERPFPTRLWAMLAIRPYGDSLMTPAVRMWLAFSWVVVFIMSLVEATVWGAVSRYLVPPSAEWASPLVAALFFLGIFIIIWVVDVSFITSEKPSASAGAEPDRGAVMRWSFGVAVRLGIILISILVTAPFLTLVIRSDEVTRAYQAEIERLRDAQVAEILDATDRQIAVLEARQAELRAERERFDINRQAADERLGDRIERLEEQISFWEQTYRKELEGDEGRAAGFGPRARTALDNAERLRGELDRLIASGEPAASGRLREIEREIADNGERLNALETGRVDQAERLRTLPIDQFAASHGLDLPADSLGLRARLLERIKRDERSGADRFIGDGAAVTPIERFIDHFKTVDGLSQAILAILFLSLIALKAFEPRAVGLYFNEAMQYRWQRYREGAYDDMPGLAPYDPLAPLDPFGFAAAYRAYERDPDGLAERHNRLLTKQQELDAMRSELSRQRREADQDVHLQQEALALRRNQMDERHRLAIEHERAEYAQRQRELELAVADRMQRLEQEREAERKRLDAEVERVRTELELHRSEREQAIEADRIACAERTAAIERARAELEEDQRRWQTERDEAEVARRRAMEGVRRARLEARSRRLEARLAAIDAKRPPLRQRIGELRTEYAVVATEADGRRRDLDLIARTIAACQEELDEVLRRRTKRHEVAREEVVRRLIDSRERWNAVERAVAEADARRDALADVITRADEDLATLEGERERIQEELDNCEDEMELETHASDDGDLARTA